MLTLYIYHSTNRSVPEAGGSTTSRPLQNGSLNGKGIKLAPLGFPPGEAKGQVRKLLPFNQQLNCASLRADAIRPYRVRVNRFLRQKRAARKQPAMCYLLLLLVRCSEYCLMEEILLSDSDIKAFSFSSNSWSAVLGAAF